MKTIHQTLLVLFLSFCLLGSFALTVTAESPQHEGSTTQYVNLRPLPAKLEGFAVQQGHPEFQEDATFYFTLRLPEILLDSPDAEAANAEIAQLEDQLVQAFTSSYESEGDQQGYRYVQTTNYSVYARNGLLSICIKAEDYNYNDDAPWSFGHYIYNFDLATGKSLSDTDLLDRLAGQSVDLDLLWETNLVRNMREMSDPMEMASRQNMADYPELNVPGTSYIGLSDYQTGLTLLNWREQNYWLNDHALTEPAANKLYISKTGELTMVYLAISQVGAGKIVVDGPFYLDVFPTERTLNPRFVTLMDAFGQDPWVSQSQALLAFLGPIYDADTASQALYKIFALNSLLGEDFTPTPLLSHQTPEEACDRPVGTFSELYLLVPKYQNDVVEMVALELSPQGTIEPAAADPWFPNTQVALDTALVGISTETMPSAGLRISNVQAEGDLWYPHFSGKDGSLILPDFIWDMTGDLDQLVSQYPNLGSWLDEDLLSYILSYSDPDSSLTLTE